MSTRNTGSLISLTDSPRHTLDREARPDYGKQSETNIDNVRKRQESSPQVGYDEADSTCGAFIGTLIWLVSMFFICCTFPFSLFFTVKQVQEYERAVIFRLGRIKRGGAVGPGLFFIIPCMDTIQVVDLRTVSFDVPPQEVKLPCRQGEGHCIVDLLTSSNLGYNKDFCL